MRRCRFLIAIILAWALAAQGLLSHAAAAHKAAPGAMAEALCQSRQGGDEVPRATVCADQCLSASWADMTSPPTSALPATVHFVLAAVAPTASRAAGDELQSFDHAPRGPPAAA